MVNIPLLLPMFYLVTPPPRVIAPYPLRKWSPQDLRAGSDGENAVKVLRGLEHIVTGRNGELEAPSRGSSSSSTEVTINVWTHKGMDKLSKGQIDKWMNKNEWRNERPDSRMNSLASDPVQTFASASFWVLGACPGLSRLVTPARAPPTWAKDRGLRARWNLSIQRYPIWDAKREAWMASHGHSHLWNPSGKNVTHLPPLPPGLD